MHKKEIPYGLEPIISGYGGIGLLRGGSGSVPKAEEAFDFAYCGALAEVNHPDYIVINYGQTTAGLRIMRYILTNISAFWIWLGRRKVPRFLCSERFAAGVPMNLRNLQTVTMRKREPK